MVESRQEEVLAIIAIFSVFAFLFVAVRIYSRYLGRNFGWDDYLIILAMVFFFFQTLTIWKCKYLHSIRHRLGIASSLPQSSHTSKWYRIPHMGPTQEDHQRASSGAEMEYGCPNDVSSAHVLDPGIDHNVPIPYEGQPKTDTILATRCLSVLPLSHSYTSELCEQQQLRSTYR
jgi:hypothetical protein